MTTLKIARIGNFIITRVGFNQGAFILGRRIGMKADPNSLKMAEILMFNNQRMKGGLNDTQ